jgi:DNA invertase Pin-like site-specific DNA recombinase
MLKFVKSKQHTNDRISYIIVYSTDRFSRSGANAIYIASELKKQGIAVISVTQPTDSYSASGNLQQNIQFIFSEYDNQLRREKCLAGTRERLLSGFWVTKAPFGYDQITRGQSQTTTINADGEKLKLAFEWKASGMQTNDIADKLNLMGLKVTAK